MTQLLNIVMQFFKDDDWDFDVQSSRDVLQMRFSGVAGDWVCFANVKEDAEQVLFFSVAPLQAPADKRRDVAELLARINYGIPIGNFEMDFTDGEIRYKTSIDVEGSHLDTALVQNLVYANVQLMNTYLSAIEAVIDGTASPADAVDAVE